MGPRFRGDDAHWIPGSPECAPRNDGFKLMAMTRAARPATKPGDGKAVPRKGAVKKKVVSKQAPAKKKALKKKKPPAKKSARDI